MPKQFISPEGLAKTKGYSQVVKAGNLVFIAGQISMDKDGQLVGKDNVYEQAVQVYENLATALASVGGSKDDLVATTTYLVNAEHIPAVRKAREEFYGPNPPTSTMLLVSGLVSPDFLIEVESIASID